MPEGLTITHADLSMKLGVRGNLLMAYFVQSPRYSQSVEFRKQLEGLIAKHADGIGYLVLTPEHPGTIDVESRKVLTEFLKGAEQQLRGIAIVVPQEGLSGAARRTLLSAAFLVMRKRKHAAIFKTVAEAAMWLAPMLSESAATAISPFDIGRDMVELMRLAAPSAPVSHSA